MLAQLESGELPVQILSRRGRALYLMIPEHVSRVTGDTRAFWAYRGPYYALDQGGVAHRRSFETGRPFTTALYRRFLDLKRHSKFLTLIDLQLPPRIPEDALELTARVDEQADPDCDHHPSGRLNAGLAAAIAADLGGGTRTPRHAILARLRAVTGLTRAMAEPTSRFAGQ